MDKPLRNYSDEELEQALLRHSHDIQWAYNTVVHEMERRTADRDRVVGLVLAGASALVAAAALVVSVVALLN